MTHEDAYIKEVIRRAGLWDETETVSVEELGGGVTNSNYRVGLGDRLYAVRISAPGAVALGIDRRQEYLANVAAAKQGIAPEVVAFVEPEGHLITQFVTGRHWTWEEIRHPKVIERVAGVLKRIHSLPPMEKVFSPFGDIKSYRRTVRQFGYPMSDTVEHLFLKATAIARDAISDPCPAGLCHNDAVRRNFIADGDALWVIDWEYAGMGNVYYDLATFATNHEFDANQEQRLIAAYFGETSREHVARFNRMQFMFLLREVLWALVKASTASGSGFNYQDYADKLLERLS